MSWSSTAIGSGWGDRARSASSECVGALHELVQDNQTLAVATEASSHLSGLDSLWAQPGTYAGGGLGNYDECPSLFCLAGGTSRDSFTFAAVCVPHECSALDLEAPDYLPGLKRAVATTSSAEGVQNVVAQDYYNLQEHVRDLNHLLRTGWTCGNFQVPWNIPGFLAYFSLVLVFFTLGLVGTLKGRTRRLERQDNIETAIVTPDKGMSYDSDKSSFNDDEEEKKECSFETLVKLYENGFEKKKETPPQTEKQQYAENFWTAWDMTLHYGRIGVQRKDTACLDGLRVGSILWIILGHVMAIQSSAGAGYNNPKHFLPPQGLTTTLGGQLLFASRFAVDTFLFISGFLVVRVLGRVPMSIPSASREPTWPLRRYLITLPGLVLHRVLRILPLYGTTLGFWIVVAPHLGGGPFWYQWLALLKPCMEYGWTNLLFVNNFIPADLANTETCFYHSWYLAIDLQLFLVAPLLVYWYRQSHTGGRRATAVLALTSVCATMYLSYVRKWSVNTFDGAAVARFDVEGYAKPHVRAQSYLSGMLLAMCVGSFPRIATKITFRHRALMITALSALAFITFGTVTGAYSRRPCRYEEWPTLNECGSTWSPVATFLYAAAGRAVWSLSIAILVWLCLTGHGGVVGSMLSWKIWTPLSQLSYGAYLVHPICIFVWQLGDTQKDRFSLLSFTMNYISVTVVSFAVALVLALVVEFPCATLQKRYLGRKYLTRQRSSQETLPDWSEESDGDSVPLMVKQNGGFSGTGEMYGALSPSNEPGRAPRTVSR